MHSENSMRATGTCVEFGLSECTIAIAFLTTGLVNILQFLESVSDRVDAVKTESFDEHSFFDAFSDLQASARQTELSLRRKQIA